MNKLKGFVVNNFIKIKSNIADVVFLTLITVMILMDLYAPKRFHHSNDILAFGFISVRYSIQVYRFVKIVINAHSLKQSQNMK